MTNTELIGLALEARSKAYIPYSGYAVGAALIAGSGKVYTGCNIENAAYSPTNCAERTAIFKAVSEGEREVLKIAIVAGKKELTSPLPAYAAPCGVCRQVIAEFAKADAEIILAKSPEDYEIFKLSDILPLSFTAKDL